MIIPIKRLRESIKMAAALTSKRLSKSDAQTIALGEQLSGDVEKRLRSSSGKIYHAEINVAPQSTCVDKMGSIEEVIAAGGIDHAEDSQGDIEAVIEKASNAHEQDPEGKNKCCGEASQIILLIKKLQDTVDTMHSKINDSATFQANTEQRLSDLEKKQLHDAQEVASVNEIVQQYQVKVDILSDVVIRQQTEIDDLKTQMLEAQARGMRCNITIHGIPERAHENCLSSVNQFIVEKLQIKDKLIPIEQAYRYGSGKTRPILVMLRHWSDKALIFQHVSNLKGLRHDGAAVFVSSQLPEALNEKRRKVNSYMAANKKKPVDQKLPYSVKQGELLFNNKVVSPKVWTPRPRELLKLTDPELDQINDIRLIAGVTEEEGSCTFRGYAAKATSHTEVNDAYKKIKLMHGEATHIACAYRLKSCKPPYDADGCDDREYGASRVLLQEIHDTGVSDVAVFMVRYYGGKKLGPRRFELMKKTVSSAITLWQVSLQDQHPSGDSWGEDQNSEPASPNISTEEIKSTQEE